MSTTTWGFGKARGNARSKAFIATTLILGSFLLTGCFDESADSSGDGAKPQISGSPPKTKVAGSFYDFQPTASDADSAQLEFSIANKPRWANFDYGSGRLYGTPSAIDVGKNDGIQISVSDGEKTSKLPKFSIEVVAGVPPVINGTPPTDATEGQPYQFQPSASDGDGQALQFSIINKPSWASLDPATGLLSGTPPFGSAGTYASIVISVTDGATTVGLSPFSIEVAPGNKVVAPNNAPQIEGTPPTAAQVGLAYAFTPSATDKDGDSLTFTAVNLPAWLTIDRASGQLSGKPQSGDEGNYTEIVVSVSDGKDVAFIGPFAITVTTAAPGKTPPPNAAPQIGGTPGTSVAEGKEYAFQPTATDADGDPLTFSVANAPAWLTISPTTGLLSGIAPAGSAGTYTGIVLSVTDGVSTVSLPAFPLTVTAKPDNSPPTIGGTPPARVTVGQTYNFEPLSFDADGDTLTFSVVNKPSWIVLNSATGKLTGVPGSAHLGKYDNIRVNVWDGKATASTATFSITVVDSNAGNVAPSISGVPATAATVGTTYSFQPTASDPEGDALTFAATGVPTWLTFNPATGRLSGTPPAGTAGTYGPIVISVSDGNGSASLAAFTITVTDKPNTPPTISGTPATSATVGKAYAFQATANDPDGQTLRFGIANQPSWATFDVNSGRLSGTPGAGDVGTFANIVVSVSDGIASATLPAFSITVEASQVENRAPTISGGPSTTATEGSAYSFQPSASDPDGDPLTFSISGLPGWAAFNNGTGRLTGTPPLGSAGSYGPVTITVSDGKLSASLPAFTITVSPKPNTKPTISGLPATKATVGVTYNFQASADDPDGQTLRFGIANKPAWATFDIVTGRLTGTPGDGDVGTYANIVISVSDGTDSATLPAFTITVSPPVIGSAELTWTAPTQNEDGSALTNLAGYKIRYGTSPGSLTQVVDVVGAGATSTTIEGLKAGTWYFSVASYTNTGVESAPTGTVYKTIQ